MTRSIATLTARRHDDRGFTLVELMVATSLFLVLSGLMFTVVTSGARVVKTSRKYNDLNEEARVMLNRMSREIREAKAITAVTNPGFAPGVDRSITFTVDFDGDGVIEPNAADPEVLTYRYEAAAKRVTLTAGGASVDVLAANVTKFALDFTSSAGYLYDANPADGTTTWQELDADTTGRVGNRNGVLDQELLHIDSVTIQFTVLDKPHQQDYRTTIDLRNGSAL
jgi:prepilin-type N-terminal cleavage/methylation domain-containing protein